jgi:hypothetical protein
LNAASDHFGSRVATHRRFQRTGFSRNADAIVKTVQIASRVT